MKVVARAGVGLDNIDLDACKERGVVVVHTPAANTQAVVEFVTAQILGALRPTPALQSGADSTRWRELRREAVVERQLSELTLGIWGWDESAAAWRASQPASACERSITISSRPRSSADTLAKTAA